MFASALLALVLAFGSSEYCAGWSRGYVAGYCRSRAIAGYCTAPIVPVCPIPRAGYDRFEDGYGDGFVAATER